MNTAADLLGRSDLASRPMTVADEAQKLLQDKAPKNDRKPKKPKGMKREVFDLITNPEEPPAFLAPKTPSGGFKAKRTMTAEGKWVWSQIESSARTDGLKSLGHWVRSDKFYADYPYAQFNVKAEPVIASDEVYFNHCQDPLWTKDDTDRLLSCCHIYDLRWPVIYDRLSLSSPKPLEQCQARYYFIVDTLQHLSGHPHSSSSTAKQSFPLDTEAQRRQKQERLYHL